MDQEKPEIGVQLTLIDHLAELRSRLIYSAYAIVLATIGGLFFTDRIFDIIRLPIAPYLSGGGLIFTAPMDKFVAHLKIALLFGVICATPFWLYQLWKFIVPALHQKEKKIALSFISSGSILFLCGISFAYFLVYPAAFNYLMTFGGTIDKPMITINEYLSFFISTTLLFGLAFELPLVLVILGYFGIINQKFLKSKRRYAIVLMALISGFITPPDLLSMLMLLIPLVFLYEVSILLVGFFERKKLRPHS